MTVMEPSAGGYRKTNAGGTRGAEMFRLLSVLVVALLLCARPSAAALGAADAVVLEDLDDAPAGPRRRRPEFLILVDCRLLVRRDPEVEGGAHGLAPAKVVCAQFINL